MYLKIMGPENAPDADTRKTFRLIECREAQFYRDDDGNAFAYMNPGSWDDGYELPIVGNAYLMNESGKTVASFGSARLGCRTEDWPEVGEAA